MAKVPFVLLAKQVDKLYEKQIDIDNIEEINKHCEFIAAFINASGYSEEEYIRLMFGFECLKDLN